MVRVGPGVEVVLQDRLEGEPARDLKRVVEFQRFLRPVGQEPRLREGVIQNAADAAVDEPDCDRVPVAMRNQTVISNSTGYLGEVPGNVGRSPIKSKVEVET